MKRPRRRDIRAKKRRQQIPTEAAWENYKDDLDTEYSHRMFCGRSNEEMRPYFHNNPIEATSEVRWMPKIPFQYYMIGFRDFVNSVNADNFDQASDAANCFMGLVLEKLDRHPEQILPIMPELISTLEFIANNQARFDADEKIYGSFPEKLKQIISRHRALGGC